MIEPRSQGPYACGVVVFLSFALLRCLERQSLTNMLQKISRADVRASKGIGLCNRDDLKPVTIVSNDLQPSFLWRGFLSRVKG